MKKLMIFGIVMILMIGISIAQTIFSYPNLGFSVDETIETMKEEIGYFFKSKKC